MPVTKPVLLHVKSVKGKGYPPAEAASDKYHGVAKFDVASGKQKVTESPMLLAYLRGDLYMGRLCTTVTVSTAYSIV